MNDVLAPLPITSQVKKAEVISDNKFSHQRQISAEASDVEVAKQAVKTLAEQLAQECEKLPAFDRVADLEGQLEVAREELHRQEIGSAAINGIKDKLAEARRELKLAAGALSSLLIHFMADYRQRSLDVNQQHRAIDVSAKLGKALDKQEVLPL